jgi:hypothetical protein
VKYETNGVGIVITWPFSIAKTVLVVEVLIYAEVLVKSLEKLPPVVIVRVEVGVAVLS